MMRSVFGRVDTHHATLSVELPAIEGARALQPWSSRWDIDSRRRVYVVAYKRGNRTSQEVVDAREWVETLHDKQRWPDGTFFELVIVEADA